MEALLQDEALLQEGVLPGLGECPVVADVAVPGKHVGQIPVGAMTLVLDDGVELEVSADLELGLTEPRDLHHHVVKASLLARD